MAAAQAAAVLAAWVDEGSALASAAACQTKRPRAAAGNSKNRGGSDPAFPEADAGWAVRAR